MQQLWAEVFTLYDAGESWHLTPDEVDALNERNRDHEAINPIHDLIDQAFDWSAPASTWTSPMRTTEIVMAAGIERPNKKDVNEAAAYLQKRYAVDRRMVGKERLRFWFMPSRDRSFSSDSPW